MPKVPSTPGVVGLKEYLRDRDTLTVYEWLVSITRANFLPRKGADKKILPSARKCKALDGREVPDEAVLAVIEQIEDDIISPLRKRIGDIEKE